MRRYGWLFAMVAVIGLVACEDDGAVDDVTNHDSWIVGPDHNSGEDQGEIPTDEGGFDLTADETQIEDIGVDTTVQDVIEDTMSPDATPDIPMETRHFTFRAIGGVSMGAAALTVASHYPDEFDNVGALGGYVDYRYMGHLMRDLLGGGFCSMDQLLQPAVLADIDNDENPDVFCGNDVKLQAYEFYWDFNHLHYDDDGGTWKRDSYMEVVESLVFAFGNFMYYNPDHPLLPPGVDVSWLEEADKCANPAVIGYPNNIQAEYNPKGEYNLITFCDGDTQVGCYEDNPELCGENNPDYRELAGTYNPDQEYHVPVYIFLAVDYNGNGERDYGEPVVFNMSERWDDVGLDGCANEFENGQGGCNETATGSQELDANGDDFDITSNPLGREGNYEYDDGEPYSDFGIDGVAQAVSGTKDFGEDDGNFTYNPRYEDMIMHDARHFFRTADLDVLRKHSYYLEGGIRDMLHAVTSVMNLSAALVERGLDVRRYDSFTGQPNAIFPDLTDADVNNPDSEQNMGTLDFSKTSFGANVLMAYGDASQSEAMANNTHSGKHVGSGTELLLRPTMFFTMAMARMPNPVYIDDWEFNPTIEYRSYYSDILQSRRWYAVNLPPNYYVDAAPYNEVEYPLGIMLPGVGMPLMETIEATRLLNLTQGYGFSPRFILLTPDGQCCYRDTATDKRLCNCYRISGGLRCVDADCMATHEECMVYDISRDNIEQECNSGHFFVNQASNRWGETDMDTSRFEDALFEVIDVVEDEYRVRKPADVEVPVGF